MKVSIGIILSSIGIIWNESLQSIVILKEYATYVIDAIENNSTIKIQRVVPTNNELNTL
jgi:hypothetical protein